MPSEELDSKPLFPNEFFPLREMEFSREEIKLIEAVTNKEEGKWSPLFIELVAKYFPHYLSPIANWDFDYPEHAPDSMNIDAMYGATGICTLSQYFDLLYVLKHGVDERIILREEITKYSSLFLTLWRCKEHEDIKRLFAIMEIGESEMRRIEEFAKIGEERGATQEDTILTRLAMIEKERLQITGKLR